MADKGLIICGFPGIGKTTLCEKANQMGVFTAVDCESSGMRFIWEGDERKKNPEFPGNYVDLIENLSGKSGGYDYIFVSTHETVRNELKSRGIPYIIVAPYPHLRNEYMRRYVARGSDMSLIERVWDNWTNWMEGLMRDGAPIIWLSEGEVLADVFPQILVDVGAVTEQ